MCIAFPVVSSSCDLRSTNHEHPWLRPGRDQSGDRGSRTPGAGDPRLLRRAGLGKPRIFADAAASGTLDMLHREAGRKLSLEAHRGDHVVVMRFDRLADRFVEAALTLDNWHRQGIVVHVLDIGCILDPRMPDAGTLIEMVLAFARYWQDMIGIRSRESFSKLQGDGHRCSRHAPFGFKWVKRGGKTFREGAKGAGDHLRGGRASIPRVIC